MPVFRIRRFLVFPGYTFGKLEACPTTNSAVPVGSRSNDDRPVLAAVVAFGNLRSDISKHAVQFEQLLICLLYTSDAADE